MASYEERLEQVEHALARAAQMQEQGQARLEQALKRAEGLIPAAGEAVAGAMQASAAEVAKVHRAALAEAVEDVAATSRQAVAEASSVVQELRKAIQAEAQASQQAAAKERQLEAALDALLPKVAAVQEGLEKKLGGMVQATAATEGEVRGLVATMKANLTKEIETEVRAKLRDAADNAAHRVYGLAEWWERFTRVGIPAVLLVFVVVSGGLGWWFGKHQLEADTYQKALGNIQKNAEVWAYAYQFNSDPDGTIHPKRIPMEAPLAWTAPGKFVSMTKNAQGQWVYGNAVVEPGNLLSAVWWDSSNEKEWALIKANKP